MKTLLTPTSINLLAYVNDQLITERRRGFDGTVQLPDLRVLAKAVVHERGLVELDTTLPLPSLGEFK